MIVTKIEASIQIYIQQPVPVAGRSKAWVCGHSPAEIVCSNPTDGIDICCECCVLSGRGLCDELITRPEESYRLWCVVVCDLENLKNEEVMTRIGSQCHRKNICTSISYEKQICTVYFIWKLLYMFRVVTPPIINSSNNCIYSIWYSSHRNVICRSWKSWNWFVCAVGGVRHQQHTQTCSNSSTIATDNITV
jgi:hypothetical protein